MGPRNDDQDAGRKGSWAILRTGGKQYRVRTGDRLDVARSDYIAATVPDADGRRLFSFDDVLVVQPDEGEAIVGAPNVPNARVVAELLTEQRTRKVIAFKKRRRQNSRRRRGHRQWFQPVVVVAVECGRPPPSDPLAKAPVKSFAVTEPPLPWSDRAASILSSLRGKEPDEALAILGDSDLSSRTDAPAWVKAEFAKALEPLLTGGGVRRRWSAALALSAVIDGPVGEAATPDAVAAALKRHFDRVGRRHFLEVELLGDGRRSDASDDRHRHYKAKVRLKNVLAMPVGNAGLKLARGLSPEAILQTNISGPGVDAESIRVVWRSGNPAGIWREWVTEFSNDASSGNHAVLDVVIDGRRVERRFLHLDRLAISRDPPARPVGEAGTAAL